MGPASILILEPICWGSEHLAFNSGLAETVRLAFPGVAVRYCGEESHVEEVRCACDPALAETISWQTVPIPPRRQGFWKRLPSEVRLLRQILEGLPNGTTLLLTSAAPSTLVSLRIVESRLRNLVAIQVVLHGIAGQLGRKRSRNPFVRLRDLSTAVSILGRVPVQFIVLENVIRKELAESARFLRDRIEVLEHPAAKAVDLQSGPPGLPLRLGFFGRASVIKGFPIFARVAIRIRKRYPGRAEFHAFGRVPLAGINEDMSGLVTTPSRGPLDRGVYAAGLERMDFLVFPFEDPYQFSASGTLMDAIAYGKPIIARRLPLFDDLFRRYGDIGYLFDTEAGLEEIVAKLIENPDAERYEGQMVSLRTLAVLRRPESLAPSYREVHKKAVTLAGRDEANLGAASMNGVGLKVQ